VTFIGAPTNGANGDITNMVLPGNLFVSFTGQKVRHPDDRQLQRVGVQPHITVKPTIAGIRAGRDELLEAAIEYLRRRHDRHASRWRRTRCPVYVHPLHRGKNGVPCLESLEQPSHRTFVTTPDLS